MIMQRKSICHFFSGLFVAIILAQTTLPSMATDDALLEKPGKTGCILWLQQLEKKRDEAVRLRQRERRDAITHEISATIAGKYGISERSATPEEKIVIMHSIIRTRRGFFHGNDLMYRNNLIHELYLDYNRSKTNDQLRTDSIFKDHMAAVLAIDVMVMKSFVDGDFAELWGEANKKSTVSQDLISGVISHAQAHEKREVFNSLTQNLQAFMHTRHRTICLANDVFSVFAPRIGLTTFYSELIGGTYQGWDVHGGDDLANIITSEDIINSGCWRSEGEIKTMFCNKLSELSKLGPGNDIYVEFNSAKATHPTDELRRKFNLQSDEMVVQYVYDPNPLFQAVGIRGMQEKTFYLSRSVKNPLIVQLLTGVAFNPPVSITSETESNDSEQEEEMMKPASTIQSKPAPSSARVASGVERDRSIPTTPQTKVRPHAVVPQQRLLRVEVPAVVGKKPLQ